MEEAPRIICLYSQGRGGGGATKLHQHPPARQNMSRNKKQGCINALHVVDWGETNNTG